MPALFPNSVRVYTGKTDLVDTVLAEHVNLLQDEMSAVQTTLGTSLLTSTWSGTYTQPETHTSVSGRLANIEAGLGSLSSTKLNLTGGTLSGALSGTSATFTSLTATTLAGSGAALTNLNASNLASGTVPSARMSGTYDILSSQNVSRTNGSVTEASNSSAVVRNIHVSTAAPGSSDGQIGDVWLRTTG